MTRARAALLLGGLFVLGLACGALGMAAYGVHRLHVRGPSHERMERFVVRRLSRRLDLDDAQRRLVEDVVRRTRARLEEVHRDVLPRVDSILDDAYHEILPALRPDQQDRLEAVRARVRERLHRRRDPAE